MKKSEAYHLAQMAVVNSPAISPEAKIEVMRILLEDEAIALYSEKRQTEREAAAE